MGENEKLPPLDSIPGLCVKDILLEDGEFVANIEYVTEKDKKIYRLIAGKSGLRIELSRYERIR